MVDLSTLKKGKIIKTSNGIYCKVLNVKNYNDIYFITTDNTHKTGFYNKDGTVWKDDSSIRDKIIKII